jgi:hypothetical protein
MIDWKRVAIGSAEVLLNALLMWLILIGVVFICNFPHGIEAATLLTVAFSTNDLLRKDVTRRGR